MSALLSRKDQICTFTLAMLRCIFHVFFIVLLGDFLVFSLIFSLFQACRSNMQTTDKPVHQNDNAAKRGRFWAHNMWWYMITTNMWWHMTINSAFWFSPQGLKYVGRHIRQGNVQRISGLSQVSSNTSRTFSVLHTDTQTHRHTEQKTQSPAMKLLGITRVERSSLNGRAPNNIPRSYCTSSWLLRS